MTLSDKFIMNGGTLLSVKQKLFADENHISHVHPELRITNLLSFCILNRHVHLIWLCCICRAYSCIAGW